MGFVSMFLKLMK
uniref:Uncharacterized protein n=1 Tax=Arundo donax TaxID=35708 RepID=A0A0A9FHR1_ARUDO